MRAASGQDDLGQGRSMQKQVKGPNGAFFVPAIFIFPHKNNTFPDPPLFPPISVTTTMRTSVTLPYLSTLSLRRGHVLNATMHCMTYPKLWKCVVGKKKGALGETSLPDCQNPVMIAKRNVYLFWTSLIGLFNNKGLASAWQGFLWKNFMQQLQQNIFLS